MTRTLCTLWNALMLPLRLTASHRFLNRLGLRSMRDERMRTVLEHCRGRLLDVGCGEGNRLVRSYDGPGVGVDVFAWPGIDLLCDTARLPFTDGTFQTVTMLATLNHIPNRRDVLSECRRVLSTDGRILITMIGPFIGKLRHRLAWWDADQTERKLSDGELMGMDESAVCRLLTQTGFNLKRRIRLVCGLNSIYVAEPARQPRAGKEPGMSGPGGFALG